MSEWKVNKAKPKYQKEFIDDDRWGNDEKDVSD